MNGNGGGEAIIADFDVWRMDVIELDFCFFMSVISEKFESFDRLFM